MSNTSRNYFYCFSPLVMITTFTIELFAALYILYRYRISTTSKLITAMLANLALFQFAEYMICQSSYVLSSLDWARIGYIAITILPPIGIHLGLTIAKQKNTQLLIAAYGSAAIFTAFFLFVGNGIQSSQCLGNYVIFDIASAAVIPYGVYYNGWLIMGIYLFWSSRERIVTAERKQALLWLTVGYLSFLIPTTLVTLIEPATIRGIPSIMCGFAVFMALCLLFKVAPLVLKDTKTEQQHVSSR